ncbi:BrnA antitoxin family protein [Roseinatronobacter thiooxidans]|nr:BrnA antitoxin family protein [Roseinatronobacter thiooxidans]
MESRTDWDALRRAEALGLEPERDDDEFELDWTRAELVTPEPKKAISLRVDPDVLEFFKSQGAGYQTRMNAVLRAWMDAQLKR